MRDLLRIRLVFDDRHLLTKGHRSESLRRCWCLLTPDIATIADLVSHISRLFDLHRSCPDGVLLFMDDFVLPSFESSSIIRDKDIISVRKKTVKLRKVVNIEHDALQIQDCEIVEKQTIACGEQLLAIKELEEELEGHESEDEENVDDHPEKAISEETPVGVQINSKRKKRSSEDLGPRRKKLKQTSFEELIEPSARVDEIHIEHEEVSLKKKARSSKNGHRKGKVPSSDFASDGMTTPTVGVNDKNIGGSVTSEGRGKKLKSTRFEELIGASERDDEIHSEKEEVFSKKKGGSRKNHKKRKVPLGDTVSDGMFTPEVGTSDKNIAGSVTSEERDNQVEGEIEINGCEALSEGVRKFPSRSARRKKARRKWKQLLSNSKKQEDPGNDVQITSSKNQSSETQGRDQMEENLMPQITEPQNVEQTTDSDEEVIPIVVRPGHIRFEPVDAEHSTQQTNGKMEAFHWNGITNKKKGQKWGREKGSWRNDNDDNVCTAEANEINDEVSLANDQMDFEKLMPLTSQPKEGDVLAYRLVELSSSWTPELSSFRVGKVSSYDPISKNLILLPVPNFPVFPDKEKEEEECLWQTNGSLYKEDGSLEIDYASLMDVRVFKPNKQLVLSNNKHGNMTEEPITRIGDLSPVLTNNNINGTMNLNADKTTDNEWKESKQALDKKKEQLLKTDGSSSSKNGSTGTWSYRAVRGSALGPTIALLRAENDL
ncbi:coilin protein [Dioscorea alata]|uniref:Coilin protein n=1 Tax=Dioscorea alata TaxID=55571 RepID=A0ACB7WAH7_DIOAL|nr:coilin protein [Dioscorea alata]